MADQCKVTFLPSNREVSVPRGTILLKAANIIEEHINASCGGKGTCGKCRVIIEEGEFNTSETPFLSKEDRAEGYVLACLTMVESDCMVRVPPESSLGLGQMLEAKKTWRPPIEIGHWELKPRTNKLVVELPPPSLSDNRSDYDRLVTALKQQGVETCSLCSNAYILRKLGRIVREGDWRLTVTMMDLFGRSEILDICSMAETGRHYGLAIDIGTTTIVVYLVNLIDGEIAAVASDYNAQMSCGEDIISRIVYSTEGLGLERLNELVLKTVNNLILQVRKEAQIKLRWIEGVVVSGNTTMTHLFLGIDPRYIREEPYIPTATVFPFFRASEVGLKIKPNANVYCMPCVSSYIGGDITAGVLASEINKSDELVMFIDIGTNGEIILGSKEWMVAASCSAGPAFEGGNIKNGVRAVEGAIEGVTISGETFEPTLQVIGRKKPIGICGSGIIDVVAEMFLTGLIDRKGKIQRNKKTERVRENEDGWEYVLVRAAEAGIGSDIVITEPDVDNIIRTKGAIYAGFSYLLNATGLKFDDVEQFLIAGGFGNYLNVEKGIVLGLFPEIPVNKFKYLGNTSITGSYLTLLSKNMQDIAQVISHQITYMELSASPTFMHEYVSALFLPHTDIDRFPLVSKMLEGKICLINGNGHTTGVSPPS